MVVEAAGSKFLILLSLRVTIKNEEGIFDHYTSARETLHNNRAKLFMCISKEINDYKVIQKGVDSTRIKNAYFGG